MEDTVWLHIYVISLARFVSVSRNFEAHIQDTQEMKCCILLASKDTRGMMFFIRWEHIMQYSVFNLRETLHM
jgi:hypothetical protein